VSLLDAYLRSGDHAAALAEVDRFRAVAGPRHPEHPFERAAVDFAAGRVDKAAADLAAVLDTIEAADLVQPEGRTEIIRAVAAGANVFAYQGNVEGARRVIGLAAEVGARFDSAMGQGWNLPAELVSRRMLGDLYAAVGGPVPSLRRIWETAAEASRRPRSLPAAVEAASGGSAAVGLLTASPGDTIAVTELRPLVAADVPPEVEALVALSRRDSATARRLVARMGERQRRKGDPRLGYTVFSRPVAAQVYYALGDYAGALRSTEGFDPADFAVRQFDMRWAMIPRARLLRGFAYERLGRVDLAVAEYEAVLAQWKAADPLLHPLLRQAERGLVRLGRSAQLEALRPRLSATHHTSCR
jgi:tetratricopeptide (TPR) repeat protein